MIWEVAKLCQFYLFSLLVWTYAIKSLIQTTTHELFANLPQKLYELIYCMTNMFLAEGWFFFIDFMEIAYYPASNRIRYTNYGHIFKHLTNQTIEEFRFNTAKR